MSIKKMFHLEPYYKLDGKQNLVWNKEAHENFIENFEEGFIEECSKCVQRSNDDRYKEVGDANSQKQGGQQAPSSSLLKFTEPDPIHDIISEKINESVDAIAIDREMEMEDEDTLIEKKKEELKKWFINNY
jgi:hypothetical protein